MRRGFLLLQSVCGGLVLALLTCPRPASAQVLGDFQTNMGAFTVEFFHEDSPRTVANFISLADGSRAWLDPASQKVRVGVPFFDGIIFHRVIPNFVIQGGSPQGTGTDGPGYKFPDELTKRPDGQVVHRHNAAGMMSMANSGTHTNGSQFFLTTSVTAPATFPTHLDDKHTVFGKIAAGPGGTAAQGQAVVDAIAAVPRNASDKPLTPVVMQTVRIRRVGASAEAFDALAWALPDVSSARTISSVAYSPGATPPGTTRVELTYERRRHEATSFSTSTDAKTWRLLLVSQSPVTVIAASDGSEPLNISGVGALPELFLRANRIDYTDLISRCKPELTESAEVRLDFSSPAGLVVTARRTGATSGTWSIAGPPSATGVVAPLTYNFGNGDAGFFSPVLGLRFPTDRLPWTGGATLSSLDLTLTFNANSATSGYFRAAGVNAATAAVVSGKGVFTVTAR